MKTKLFLVSTICTVVSMISCSLFIAPSLFKEKKLPNLKWPVIGIVAQELSGNVKMLFSNYSSYIAASYVKAVESSGGVVIPIVPGKSEAYYRHILQSINGIVLPGGASENKIGLPYYDTVNILYKIAKEINDNGTAFPILGVCLGYEFMITAANDDKNILHNCSIFYENSPLIFHQTPKDTNFFARLTAEQEKLLKNSNVTHNYHIWCAYVNDFMSENTLKNDWTITSTTISMEGMEFIASIEHKKYPFFGIQFHPEKSAFEWKIEENILHDYESIVANRYFYDQIVHYAKFNGQHFKNTTEETESLIYNYVPQFSYDRTSYMQVYLFKI